MAESSLKSTDTGGTRTSSIFSPKTYEPADASQNAPTVASSQHPFTSSNCMSYSQEVSIITESPFPGGTFVTVRPSPLELPPPRAKDYDSAHDGVTYHGDLVSREALDDLLDTDDTDTTKMTFEPSGEARRFSARTSPNGLKEDEDAMSRLRDTQCTAITIENLRPDPREGGPYSRTNPRRRKGNTYKTGDVTWYFEPSGGNRA
ncbi:hypothetical protein IAT38_002738 [Cryptococcus sp. DSM 104549]